MAYSIDYINLICTDLGGTGGHAYEIDALNEICTLIGATAGHSYNIDALNAICTALGYTAGHEYNIDALNAIYVGGAYVYEDDAWQAIQVGSKLNQKEYLDYLERVAADSGVVSSEVNTFNIIKGIRSIHGLSGIKLFWIGEMGLKTYVTSTNTYTSKIYSSDLVPNDAIQATQANAPHMGGLISGKKSIINNNVNQRFMTFNTLNLVSSKKYLITLIVNYEGEYTAIANSLVSILGDVADASKNVIAIHALENKIKFIGNDNGDSWDCNNIVGRTSIIQLRLNGPTVDLFLNGAMVGSRNITGNFNPNAIMRGYRNLIGNNFKGKFYGVIVNETNPTNSQIEAEYNLLRSIYPVVESANIGSENWAINNLDIVITPMHNIIPYVATQADWAALTTPGWCYQGGNLDNGAKYGKIFNGYAAALIAADIDAYNAANPSDLWEYQLPTQAEFTTLQTDLGGGNVAGGKMKVIGTTYWYGPNTGADNSSGFSAVGGGYRNADGTFGGLLSDVKFWSMDSGVSANIAYNNSKLLIVTGNSLKCGYYIRLKKKLTSDNILLDNDSSNLLDNDNTNLLN